MESVELMFDVSGIVTVVIGCLDPVLASGMDRVLNDDPRVSILSSNLKGDALWGAVVQLSPRVVVLGEAVEYEMLVRLRSWPAAPPVVLIGREDPLLAEALFSIGVECVSLISRTDDIVAAICRAGQASLKLGGRDHGVEEGDRHYSLTPREQQVFVCLSREMSYAAIALELKIHVATVRTHARAVFRKVGVKARHELVGMVHSGGPVLLLGDNY